MTLEEKASSIKFKKKISDYDALWEAFYSISNQKYHKHSRIHKRIKAMFERENLVFYTLTLTDETLCNCSLEYLKRMAQEWCSKYLSHYVGNLDFGVDERYTQRPHFHVIGNYKIKPSFDSWKYGNLDFERTYNNNYKGISHYIIKLSRHATKEATSMLFRSKAI